MVEQGGHRRTNRKVGDGLVLSLKMAVYTECTRIKGTQSHQSPDPARAGGLNPGQMVTNSEALEWSS